MNSFVVILIILLPLLANSFGFVTARRTALQQKLANHQYAKPLQHSLQMKNDFSITKAFGVGIISFGLTGLPVALLSSQPPGN